jgi:O-antigen/teichoic acid export membrane protein
MVKGVAARIATLLPAAVATLIASRIVLQHYGLDVFNTYTLVFSTMILIPLNDLGAGAALTSALAAHGGEHPHTRRVALTASRVLFGSGFALAVAALLVTAFDGWGRFLGGGAYATGAFGIAIAIYGISFVPGLGQSALLGANKNDLTIIVQGLLAPAMCVGAVLCVTLHADPFWVVVVPGFAIFVLALANAWLSARVTKLHLLPLVPKVLFRRRHPGARIRAIAGPALIITLTSPITLQGDRLILSHVSTATEVAKYSVTLQIWAPLVALIQAASRPLWPAFTRARITGQAPFSVAKVIGLFVTLAALGGVFLALIANPLANIIGNEQLDLGIALPVSMAIAITLQAAAVPLGMVLMHPDALRFIAKLALLCTPLNVALSIAISPHFGAPGPVYASIGVAFFLQTVPAMLYYRRHGIGPPPDPADLAALASAEAEVLVVGVGELAPGPEAFEDLALEDALVLDDDRAPDDLELEVESTDAPVLPAPVDLERLVRDEVDAALARLVVDLELDPRLPSASPSSDLEDLRRAVARLAERGDQLSALPGEVALLAHALGRWGASYADLCEARDELDPGGEWVAILEGDRAVLRAAAHLQAQVRATRPGTGGERPPIGAGRAGRPGSARR